MDTKRKPSSEVQTVEASTWPEHRWEAGALLGDGCPEVPPPAKYCPRFGRAGTDESWWPRFDRAGNQVNNGGLIYAIFRNGGGISSTDWKRFATANRRRQKVGASTTTSSSFDRKGWSTAQGLPQRPRPLRRHARRGTNGLSVEKNALLPLNFADAGAKRVKANWWARCGLSSERRDLEDLI